MRKAFFLPLSFIALLCISSACGWSSKQKEILSAFNSTVQYLENGDWERAAGMLSCSTMSFLDNAAGNLARAGLTEYSSGSNLLSVMYNEYIDFNGDVTIILLQGNRASVTVSSGEFCMILEDGIWKLELEQICRNGLNKAFEGSYFQFEVPE